MFFIAMIQHPELNDKIEIMVSITIHYKLKKKHFAQFISYLLMQVALAPHSSFANIRGFLRLSTPYTLLIEVNKFD